MDAIQFDVHNAWSRFHHLMQAYHFSLEGLSLEKIDSREWREIAAEVSEDEETIKNLVESKLESEVIEREIARRVLKQTIVSSMIAALEYSLIQIFSAFDMEVSGSRRVKPGRGVSPFTGSFVKDLEEQGVGIKSMPDCKEICLGIQIRHAVMHRGGLIAIRGEDSNDRNFACLVKALNIGFPISPVPWGVDSDLVQIEIHECFVENLASICKQTVDEFHRRLVEKLAESGTPGPSMSVRRNADVVDSNAS